MGDRTDGRDYETLSTDLDNSKSSETGLEESV